MGLLDSKLGSQESELVKIFSKPLTKQQRRKLREDFGVIAKEMEECRMKNHDAPDGEILWRGMKINYVVGDTINASPDFLYGCKKCGAPYKFKDLPKYTGY